MKLFGHLIRQFKLKFLVMTVFFFFFETFIYLRLYYGDFH